ncbi:hypothetical protein [Actinomadura violacea]|uniref:Uncharacterized protein n=1 Tax=Actinomadura violacea TaxID=2819934 RepID=A0ABS3RSW6_9ACTN|nr:hypothetical protein [Actinomadura violacea]MBO2459822.1 hypothetical protein [Actinomadura violacea]
MAMESAQPSPVYVDAEERIIYTRRILAFAQELFTRFDAFYDSVDQLLAEHNLAGDTPFESRIFSKPRPEAILMAIHRRIPCGSVDSAGLLADVADRLAGLGVDVAGPAPTGGGFGDEDSWALVLSPSRTMPLTWPNYRSQVRVDGLMLSCRVHTWHADSVEYGLELAGLADRADRQAIPDEREAFTNLSISVPFDEDTAADVADLVHLILGRDVTVPIPKVPQHQLVAGVGDAIDSISTAVSALSSAVSAAAAWQAIRRSDNRHQAAPPESSSPPDGEDGRPAD